MILEQDKILAHRKLKDKLFKLFIITFSILATLPLLFILYYIFSMGVSSLSWAFFTELPKPPGEDGGGIFNAIIGTLMLIFTATIISVPPAVGIGIYLAENKKGKIFSFVQTSIELLQGVPSIVIGIIIYVWVVQTVGSFSALSGSIALAIMMIPIVAKSTEETLKLIPHNLKEASMALGVPYYKTIIKVILPTGMSGIVTGILLAVARISGETAPLLFTAFGNPFLSYDMTKPMNSLPLLIFNYAGSPYEEWHRLAWGASFVLIMIVLLLNIFAKLITRKWKIKY